MSVKSKWRGYIDAQAQTNYPDTKPVAVARRKGLLKELAELLKVDIEEYRSGYMIVVDDIDKRLPQKIDSDYIRGWFLGTGKRKKDPSLRLTITGKNVETFRTLVKEKVGIELPEAQLPNKKQSKSKRVIVTHSKAAELDEWLRA